MTPGVAILINQIALVAAVRGWDKEKTIGKLEDAITVLKGGDPPAHSEKDQAKTEPQSETQSAADLAVVKQAEEFLKTLLLPPPDSVPPTN